MISAISYSALVFLWLAILTQTTSYSWNKGYLLRGGTVFLFNECFDSVVFNLPTDNSLCNQGSHGMGRQEGLGS